MAGLTLRQVLESFLDGEYSFCPSVPRDGCEGCEVDWERLERDIRQVIKKENERAPH